MSDDNQTTPQEAPKRRGNPNFGKRLAPEVQETVSKALANEHVQAQTSTDDVLQKVLKEMQELRATNEALKSVVDQQKLMTALNKTNEDKRLQVRLRTFDGKPIIAWSNLLKNEVRYYKGEEISEQVTRITFIDGHQEEHPYEYVFNNTNRTEWLSVNGVLQKNGKSYYLVEVDGKDVEVEDTFINA